MNKRKKTKQIMVGSVCVGGDAPITVQSMTNTDTQDVKATILQIEKATDAGCDIIRVSCPNDASALAFKEIVKNSRIPIIADIHFDYRLAIRAIENGAHCIRINPGNIGDVGVSEIIKSSKDHGNSIRIGVNSGSVERDILEKHGEPSCDAIVESALLNIKKLEDMDFTNFKISVKSSDVVETIRAYRKLSARTDYPLHVGVTEAGPVYSGTIKSAIGIGSLLADGIGDTIRVSLSSSDITEEIRVGREILKSLRLLKDSVNIISCPTCARILIDVVGISNKLSNLMEDVKKNLTISILGCVVNGPGEAKESDIGIFGFQKGIAKIYVKGEFLKTCSEGDVVETVIQIVANGK